MYEIALAINSNKNYYNKYIYINVRAYKHIYISVYNNEHTFSQIISSPEKF